MIQKAMYSRNRQERQACDIGDVLRQVAQPARASSTAAFRARGSISQEFTRGLALPVAQVFGILQCARAAIAGNRLLASCDKEDYRAQIGSPIPTLLLNGPLPNFRRVFPSRARIRRQISLILTVKLFQICRNPSMFATEQVLASNR